MTIPMGIGRLGQPNVIIKRKFRFTLGIETPLGIVPFHYVKVASRPSYATGETEIQFLNDTMWIPNKTKLNPITVTYHDVVDRVMVPLYDWLLSIHNFNDIDNLRDTEKPGWNSRAILRMYDGVGTPLETWVLGNVFPTDVDFGDVDYESNDLATISLTLRYSRLNYISDCGTRQPLAGSIGC